MNKKYLKAFTLVELIIVITILAILATIAFVSFSNYTKSARDVSRVTSLKNIDKSFQSFQITSGKYPIPNNYSRIYLSGIFIGSQGDLGGSIGLQTGIQFDDSLGEFVYFTSNNKKYYQLSTILEKNKEFFTTQDDVGLVYLDNQSIHITDNVFDLKLDERNYTYVLGNNTILEGTGTTIFQDFFYFYDKYDGDFSFLNCENIFLDGEIGDTSFCLYDKQVYRVKKMLDDKWWFLDNLNVGKFVEYTDGIKQKNDGNDVKKYCYNNVYGVCDLFCELNASGTFISENYNCKKVPSPGYVRLGGYYEWPMVMDLGKECYVNNTCLSNIQERHKGICPTGWYIPSHSDYTLLENLLFGSSCRTSLTWQCNGLGWIGSKMGGLFEVLGGGKRSGGGFNDATTHGNWWSYNNSGQIRRFLFVNNDRVFANIPNRDNAWPVRCVKE